MSASFLELENSEGFFSVGLTQKKARRENGVNKREVRSSKTMYNLNMQLTVKSSDLVLSAAG